MFVLHPKYGFYRILTNCINPEEYLKDILMRMAIRPANADVSDLTPVEWSTTIKSSHRRQLKLPITFNFLGGFQTPFSLIFFCLGSSVTVYP